MNVAAEDRPERHRLPARASERHVTDKFGIILFVFAIVILCKGHLLHVVREKSDDKVSCDNSTTVNDTLLHFVACNGSDSKINSVNGTTANNTSENIWDKIAHKYHFLDGNYNESGTLVVWANVLFCACIIIYSTSSMRTNKWYFERYSLSAAFLLVFNFCQRIALASLYELYDIKLRLFFWCVPDIIFSTIITTKFPACCVKLKKGNPINLQIRTATFLQIAFCGMLSMIYLLLLLILIFHNFKHESGWDNHITIPILCYMCLINYYFTLMATSYITSLSAQRGLSFTCFCRGFFIVARYHFGTACYHATLILPRIRATFVTNEMEFRRNPKISAMRRFYLTHWKFPHLSPTLTAVGGHNHSESVRELLRMFTRDSSNIKDLQLCNQILRRSFGILLAIHSLVLTSVWYHGATIDPRWSVATWFVYPFSFGYLYLFLRFYDVSSDAIWFLCDGNVQDF